MEIFVHSAALDSGKRFFETYWQNGFQTILDIGSMDVNGTLRDVCPPGATYLGIDLAEGKGVDQVLRDPYSYPFPDRSFDMVVSTSCFEHDRMFWLTFLEAARVLSDRGFLYINAPATGSYHGYPHDHWRFYPDAGIALEEWGRRMLQPITLVESFHEPLARTSFRDCVMVFAKGRDFKPSRYLCDQIEGSMYVRKGSAAELTKLTNEFD
jgi:SAM-dependent methyltransferase